MKILYAGVFTEGSTNISQRDCLRKLGHEVDEFIPFGRHGVDYRRVTNFNIELQEVKDYDVVLIAKGNGISEYTMKMLKKNNGKVVLWFCDGLISYSREMQKRTMLADVAFFDKRTVLEKGLMFNDNCRYVCEGYDETVDCLQKVKKQYDISFIGQIYGDRTSFLDLLPKATIISGAYGIQHSIEVGKSKINLNSCTMNAASDRTYKIMAAGGFLMSDDWYGREKLGFIDEEDIVIYKDFSDLQEKIDYYLENEDARDKIAASGAIKAKKYTRLNWAREIMK
jgi:hypothetical protein